jgi:hypothetical protein
VPDPVVVRTLTVILPVPLLYDVIGPFIVSNASYPITTSCPSVYARPVATVNVFDPVPIVKDVELVVA